MIAAPPITPSLPGPAPDRAGRAMGWVWWIARVWSIASVALVVLFIVGERSLPASQVEWLDFLFFPAGVCAGLCLAWWREGLGGSVAVGSLVVFYLVHFLTSGTFPKGLAWLLFAAPGPLFLLCWIRSQRGEAAVP
jgi:hypothetical protein